MYDLCPHTGIHLADKEREQKWQILILHFLNNYLVVSDSVSASILKIFS